MHSLYDANMSDSMAIQNEDNVTLLPSIQLRHIALNRNKRCVLAYLYNRMRKLRELRWELGSILPPEISSNLLNGEAQWYQSYNKSLATYMRSLGEDQGFNLTTNMLPPKTPYVEVKCVVDFGKLELDDGQVILLKKNTYHLLPRAVCEPLIRQVLFKSIHQVILKLKGGVWKGEEEVLSKNTITQNIHLKFPVPAKLKKLR
ncbi:DNA replication complex GINS protein PSF1 isoform X2 [Nomia melanderi]|nr:DNA replication complex GINS protein PSF1-like isoform X2 [Nomia melanderi]